VLKRAWPWLRALIGVAILAIVVWRVGTGPFLDGLRVVNVPSVLAALGITLLTTVASAYRWRAVAHELGLALTMRRAVADYYRALFLNVVLPAGVLGDVQRAVQHGRQSRDVGRGVRAVVLERTGGQIVLIALSVVVLLAQPSVASTVVGDVATSPAAAILAGIIVLAVVVAAVTLWRGGSTSRWRTAVGTTLADLRAGLLSRRTWPVVVLVSALVLAGHVSLFLVSAYTADTHASVARLLTPIILTLLASGLPINFGGWGPRESVSVLAFQVAGLGATQGLTVAVLYGVLTFVGSLPGAVVLVARMWSGRRAQVQLEERVVAEPEPADRNA
jgi:uncharacterized membrane protein YbhN (UPF0104 family)